MSSVRWIMKMEGMEEMTFRAGQVAYEHAAAVARTLHLRPRRQRIRSSPAVTRTALPSLAPKVAQRTVGSVEN
jgi:hypothetical protein